MARHIRADFSGLVQQLPTGTKLILLHDNCTEHLKVIAHSSPSLPLDTNCYLHPVESKIASQVFSARAAASFQITENDTEGDIGFGKIFDIKSMVAAPVLIDDVPIGLIVVGRGNADSLYSEEEVAAVGKAADQIGLSLSQHTSAKARKEEVADITVAFRTTAVVTLDENLVIDEANSVATHLFNIDREELIGREIEEFFPEFASELWELSDPDIQGGQFFETRLQRPDSPDIYVDVLVVPDSINGVDISRMYLRDITDRKNAEHELLDYRQQLEERVRDRTWDLKLARDHAEQANKAKNTFLANIGQELRTPLNAIIGYAELLAENKDISGLEEAAQDVGKIIASSHELLSLINNVLELATIEAGSKEMQLESFQVESLVDDIVNTIKPILAVNSNQLNVTCEADLPEMVADCMWLRQSLLTLVSNAAKFTNNGNITIQVRSGTNDMNEASIEFIVTDNGIGIQPEKLTNLFDAFRPVDQDIHAEYGGLGLGLAISQRLCRSMGGDITVESEEGKGSTFTITMPAVVKQDTDVTPHESGADS